jgi:hypothetical protein
MPIAFHGNTDVPDDPGRPRRQDRMKGRALERGDAPMQSITGQLIAINVPTRTLTVLTNHGGQMNFRITGRAEASLKHIRLGQRVTVNFSLDLVRAGELRATALRFQPI